MTQDNRRITLISRHKQLQQRAWDSSRAKTRIILVDSFAVLRSVVSSPMVNAEKDLQHIILDRASSASEYLALLAALPLEFTGDVLMVRDDDSGFLSAMGRGGDRVLYALSPKDLQFYLETHQLVMPAHDATDRRSVVPFRPRVNAVA